MKIDLTLALTLGITFLHCGQHAFCAPDEMSSIGFSGPLSNTRNDGSIAYPSDAESGLRHKRYSVNPLNDDLGFLGAKSTKRQGDGEVDMLRNLAISRLVKRSLKRAPYSGRRMAISRLIKKSREHDMERMPVQEYDLDDLLSDVYQDTFLPQRAVKDAESSKFSALWKTRVG